MAGRLVIRDRNQVSVLQPHTFHKNRIGDIDIVIGQTDDQIARHIAAIRKALREVAPHPQLRALQKLVQNIERELDFPLAQRRVIVEAYIHNRLGQRVPA